MIPGRYTLKECSAQYKRRLFHANYKNEETSRKRRKIIRGHKKTKKMSIMKEKGPNMNHVVFE